MAIKTTSKKKTSTIRHRVVIDGEDLNEAAKDAFEILAKQAWVKRIGCRRDGTCVVVDVDIIEGSEHLLDIAVPLHADVERCAS